jgi:hypothetical protein
VPCLICQILSLYFYKMSVIYVPLFNFNVIVLVCDKEDACSALRILICLGISNMLSDIVPIAILSQALLPGSPFKCRTTVPSS